MITRQFQILFHVKDMTMKRLDQHTIAQKAGIPDFAVRRNQAQARGFSLEQLEQALRDGAAYEEAVKTGKMNDQMAVELFLLTYSRA